MTVTKEIAAGVSPARRQTVAVVETDHGAAPFDLLIEGRQGDLSVRQSAGRGLPLVLLHGNSASKDCFRHQFASPLAQTHRLIAIDLPGHGASEDARSPAEAYSFPGYAAATLEALDHLGVDRFVVVGWSLGGHVAMEIAATSPRAIGVMAVGAPPVAHGLDSLQSAFRPHPIAALVAAESLTEQQVAAFAAAATGSNDNAWLEAAIARADGRARALMFKCLLEGAYADERAFAETSQTPLAIVCGAEDPLVNADYLRSVNYAQLWGRTCQLIVRSGHAPFLDAPEIFNNLLANFADDAEARAHRLARETLKLSA